MVIDRLQLYIFFAVTTAGTIGILMDAPHIFEYVDQDNIIDTYRGKWTSKYYKVGIHVYNSKRIKDNKKQSKWSGYESLQAQVGMCQMLNEGEREKTSNE